jgi:hypothetical protein
MHSGKFLNLRSGGRLPGDELKEEVPPDPQGTS